MFYPNTMGTWTEGENFSRKLQRLKNDHLDENEHGNYKKIEGKLQINIFLQNPDQVAISLPKIVLKKHKRIHKRNRFWKLPTPDEDLLSIPSLYAEMHSLREHHTLLAMSPDLKRYYRKMLVSVNVNKTGKSKITEMKEATVGIVNKISLNLIKCSYTNRILKPFIFQDFEVNPPWLEMHSELKAKVLQRYPNINIRKSKKHPINYMYITPDHIDAINALAEVFFWPGIDVSIALCYPEFSCVVLYKRIVVGFGMMAPGTHLNEAYISFFFVRPNWRRCGIGSFILYHLINTCISWNITLHSSLSNDAILLYNKFTFKVHKTVRNFYDQHIPINTTQSGHAFLMQLEKSVII